VGRGGGQSQSTLDDEEALMQVFQQAIKTLGAPLLPALTPVASRFPRTVAGLLAPHLPSPPAPPQTPTEPPAHDLGRLLADIAALKARVDSLHAADHADLAAA
jgi:hypothetical protein